MTEARVDELDVTDKLRREVLERWHSLIERAKTDLALTIPVYEAATSALAAIHDLKQKTPATKPRGRGRPAETDMPPIDDPLVRDAVHWYTFNLIREQKGRAVAKGSKAIRRIEKLANDRKPRAIIERALSALPEHVVLALSSETQGRPPPLVTASARRSDLIKRPYAEIAATMRNTVASLGLGSGPGRLRVRLETPRMALGHALADAWFAWFALMDDLGKMQPTYGRKFGKMTGSFYRWVAAIIHIYCLHEIIKPLPGKVMRLANHGDKVALDEVKEWKAARAEAVKDIRLAAHGDEAAIKRCRARVANYDEIVRPMAESVVLAALTPSPELEPGFTGRRQARSPYKMRN
jgi:hypothetical protein